MTTKNNIDPQEIEQFNQLANDWWSPLGPMKALHDINPIRLNYIESKINLAGKTVLDMGCGGGILSEGLAQRGAIVTGCDMAKEALTVAKNHAEQSQLNITYLEQTAEELAQNNQEKFDIVTCMEMLEHIPDPYSVVKACLSLVKPGGHIIFSTINKTPKAFLFAIVMGEYVLKLIPKQTHHYEKFITPAKLSRWIQNSNSKIEDISGLSYQPITKSYYLSRDIGVNYFVHATN